jgi:hypothetical protein
MQGKREMARKKDINKEKITMKKQTEHIISETSIASLTNID